MVQQRVAVDTTDRGAPAPVGRSTTPYVIAAILVGAVVVARVAGGGRVAWLSNFLLVFSSLIVQALPFVLLGAVVSAAIEVFLPLRAIRRLTAMPFRAQLPAAAMSGVAFPLCECGSVPVARRLATKGLTAGATVAFMLAAPVINPIVLISTAIAYRGRSTLWIMVGGRFLIGLVAAMAVGWILGRRSPNSLLRRSASAGDGGDDEQRAPAVARYVRHLANDTVFMTKYLVIGAAVAAALQSLIPQSVLRSVGGAPVIDIVALMALAAILSLCSESDAFVAASFVQFGTAPQLAFLLVGPMFNLKLAALYAGTFRASFVRTVAIAVTAIVFVSALWLEVFLR